MWSPPWDPKTAEFDLQFASTLVVTPLISQYVMLHDLTIVVIAAVLVIDYWVSGGKTITKWETMRAALALLWLTCLVGPLITMKFKVGVVPLALAYLGWCLWRHSREGVSSGCSA